MRSHLVAAAAALVVVALIYYFVRWLTGGIGLPEGFKMPF